MQSSSHPSGFIFSPFHLTEGTSLDVSGCISRGRRRGGLEEARGRWETDALCLPAPETKPDIESSHLTSCPSISHLAAEQLDWDVLADGIRVVFSESDTQQGLPRPGPRAPAWVYLSAGISALLNSPSLAAGSGLIPRADEAGERLHGPNPGSWICLQSS